MTHEHLYLRLRPEVKEKLAVMADARSMSMNEVVNRLIERAEPGDVTVLVELDVERIVLSLNQLIEDYRSLIAARKAASERAHLPREELRDSDGPEAVPVSEALEDAPETDAAGGMVGVPEGPGDHEDPEPRVSEGDW